MITNEFPIYWHGICGVHYLTNVTVVNEVKLRTSLGVYVNHYSYFKNNW